MFVFSYSFLVPNANKFHPSVSSTMHFRLIQILFFCHIALKNHYILDLLTKYMEIIEIKIEKNKKNRRKYICNLYKIGTYCVSTASSTAKHPLPLDITSLTASRDPYLSESY